jgi:hypothetical protein
MRNNNKKWQDAEATEMNQLLEYQTFLDKGKGGEAPIGYKKIQCHMVYDPADISLRDINTTLIGSNQTFSDRYTVRLHTNCFFNLHLVRTWVLIGIARA